MMTYQATKNNDDLTISSVEPPLFKGIHLSTLLSDLHLKKLSVISVSIKPGAIELHLIFLEPNSKAVDFVKPLISS